MSQKLMSQEESKKFCDDTLEVEAGARAVYLMLAGRLHRIRKDRLYEPHWSSWHEFTMEFKDLSSASISKMIRVYEVFVLEYGFSEKELIKAGGWTKLYQMLKHINSKSDAKKWLDSAEVLSRQDLEKEMKEVETGVSMHECKHANTVTIIVCEDCGEKMAEFKTE